MTLDMDEKWKKLIKFVLVHGRAVGKSYTQVMSDLSESQMLGDDLPIDLREKPWPEVLRYLLEQDGVIKCLMSIPCGEKILKVAPYLLKSKVACRYLATFAIVAVGGGVAYKEWSK
jgi:hypothetical protein